MKKELLNTHIKRQTEALCDVSKYDLILHIQEGSFQDKLINLKSQAEELIAFIKQRIGNQYQESITAFEQSIISEVGSKISQIVSLAVKERETFEYWTDEDIQSEIKKNFADNLNPLINSLQETIFRLEMLPAETQKADIVPSEIKIAESLKETQLRLAQLKKQNRKKGICKLVQDLIDSKTGKAEYDRETHGERPVLRLKEFLERTDKNLIARIHHDKNGKKLFFFIK